MGRNKDLFQGRRNDSGSLVLWSSHLWDTKGYRGLWYLRIPLFFFFFFFFFFYFFCPHPWPMGVPRLGVAAARLHHSHSNARSEPHLRPMLRLAAMLDP